MPLRLAFACFISLLGARASVAQTAATHAQLVQQLQSANPLQRAAAFTALRREPDGFTGPGMPDVLRRVLERENQLAYTTMRESNGNVSIADKYGEDFGEYTAYLTEACFQYCNLQNPETIRAIMSGDYPSSGPLAERLAEHGPEILATVLADAHAGPFGRQWNGVTMLGTLAVFGHTLSASQRHSIDSALGRCRSFAKRHRPRARRRRHADDRAQ